MQPPPPTIEPAAPTRATVRRLSPLWRTAVICFVGLVVAGALVALSLFTRSVDLFVILSLAATIIVVAVGGLAVVEGWRASQQAAAQGSQGRAAGIALLAGLMLLVSAVAVSGAIWIVLLFFL